MRRDVAGQLNPTATPKYRNTVIEKDATYNDRCVTENSGQGASKSVFLSGTANIFDVGEHPGLYSELRSTSKDSSDNLAGEHRTGRDFHVVTELKVRDKEYCLNRRDVTPGLEHHHCDRSTWEQIADDKLRDDVKTDLLVRDSRNDTNRDRINEG